MLFSGRTLSKQILVAALASALTAHPGCEGPACEAPHATTVLYSLSPGWQPHPATASSSSVQTATVCLRPHSDSRFLTQPSGGSHTRYFRSLPPISLLPCYNFPGASVSGVPGQRPATAWARLAHSTQQSASHQSSRTTTGPWGRNDSKRSSVLSAPHRSVLKWSALRR